MGCSDRRGGAGHIGGIMHIPGLACQHTKSSWPCHHRRPCSLQKRHPTPCDGSPHGSLLLLWNISYMGANSRRQ